MSATRIVEAGERYGPLVVVERRDQPNSSVKCRCICGRTVFVAHPRRLSRRSERCWCAAVEARRPSQTTHGQSASKAYKAWLAMRDRCEVPTSKAYQHYGARGIAVCERWQSFENFYADMGDPRPDQSIDRIDNERGYSPDNCRWATWPEQLANRRQQVSRCSKLTHCLRGHLFCPENTWYGGGKRTCKICRRARVRRRNAERRAEVAK